MFLELMELQGALRSEFDLTLLKFASSIRRRLGKQSVMFLEPRDVGCPDESVPAQEGNLCYQSSYQFMHLAMIVIRGRFSCRQSAVA